MFTFHQTYSFKWCSSSLGSKSSSGPPPALLYFLLLGSKTLGSNNNDLPTGAQGICEDFLCVSCTKGSNFCASFDGLVELTLKHHAALSWKVPECFRTNVRSSSFKDLKFCLGARTSIWRYGGQSSPLRALNTVLYKLNSMLEFTSSQPGGYKEYHYLLDLFFS